MVDRLVIVYDDCPSDIPILMVARTNECNVTILSEFKGDEATEVYNMLTGVANLRG